MGIQDTFKKAAQSIVAAFGDVGVSTNYESFSSTTYNASAGTHVAVYATTAGVVVIFDVFRFEQIDGRQIKPNDKKALVPAKNISGVVPQPNDRIVSSSITWNVVNVQADPAGALYEMQVRKS